MEAQAQERDTNTEAWLLRQEFSRKGFYNEAELTSYTKDSARLLKDIYTYFQRYCAQDYRSLIKSVEFFAELPPKLQEEVI